MSNRGRGRITDSRFSALTIAEIEAMRDDPLQSTELRKAARKHLKALGVVNAQKRENFFRKRPKKKKPKQAE